MKGSLEVVGKESKVSSRSSRTGRKRPARDTETDSVPHTLWFPGSLLQGAVLISVPYHTLPYSTLPCPPFRVQEVTSSVEDSLYVFHEPFRNHESRHTTPPVSYPAPVTVYR